MRAVARSRRSPDRRGGARRAGVAAAGLAEQGAVRFRDPRRGASACSRRRSTCWSATAAWCRSATACSSGWALTVLRLLMQRTGIPIPVAFALTIVVNARGRGGHRRDLRAAQGDLFRVPDARLPDAAAQPDHLWVPLTGGDQGLRGGIPRPPSSASISPISASLSVLLRAAGDRAVPDAPPGAVAVRLHVAHDPRQCRARGLSRHPGVPRAADRLRGRRHFRRRRRRAHEPVRVQCLSGLRLLDRLGRGRVHDHARRHERLPRPAGRHGRSCCCSTTW